MAKKLLIATAAAASIVAMTSGAKADNHVRCDRLDARWSAAIHRTDAAFKRMGDAIVRTSDRLVGWVHRRPRS